MKKNKLFLICVSFFFLFQLYAYNSEIDFHYVEILENNSLPIPNGLSIKIVSSDKSIRFGIRQSYYFGNSPSFDIKVTKKIKYLGNIGFYNSICQSSNAPKYDFSTEQGKESYIFDMLEVIPLEYSFNRYKYVNLTASLGLGIIFEMKGDSKINPYIRIPLKLSFPIKRFEPSISVFGFATENNEFVFVLPTISLKYKY